MAAQLVPLAPTEVRRDPVASVEAAVPPMPVVQAAPPDQKNQPPKEVFELAAAVSPGAGDAERNRAAQIIRDASTEKTTKINTNPVWEGVVISLLRGNLSDAWKFYNGGPEREEEMVDAVGNKVGFKTYNARGATNTYRHRDGREMTEQEVKELSARGGAITDSDKKAIQTAGWASAGENAKLARYGLNKPIFEAQANAFEAARTASAANRNIEEQISLGKNIRGILDYIGTLKPEDRQRIFGYYGRLNAIGQGRQAGTEQRTGAQAGTLQQTTRNVSGTAGTGVQGTTDGQGIAPSGGRLSAGVSTGVGTLGQVSGGGTAGEAATTNVSSSQNLQEQQNIETAIMRELQGVIKDRKQFEALGRYLALDAANQEAYRSVPKSALPPGYVSVPEVDPRVSGYESAASNRVAQMRNNALIAAWTNELFKAQRKIAETGETLDMGKLSDDFQKSDIFKAINNTYSARLQYELTGKMPDLPKGTLRVDKSNRIIRHGEDK
jgi:hypothetical protein